MDAIDIIIILVMVAALVSGYAKGLVRQLGSIAAILLATIAARILGPSAAAWISSSENAGAAGFSIAGYLLVFCVVWLSVWLVSRLMHNALKTIKLGIVNSASGALFTLLEWSLGMSVALNLWKVISPSHEPETRLSSLVTELLPWVSGAISQHLN